jgi:hypothetical protein
MTLLMINALQIMFPRSPRNEGAAIQPLDRLAALSLSNGLRSFF